MSTVQQTVHGVEDGWWRITIDDVAYELEIEDLTLGELADVEEMGGSVSGDPTKEMRTAIAFVVIAKRRAGEAVNPDSIRDLKLRDLRQPESDPPMNRAQRRAAAKSANGGQATIPVASGT